MNLRKLKNSCSFVCVLGLFAFSSFVLAESVGQQKATLAVRGWLKHNRHAMETSIAGQEADILPYTDNESSVLYYIVNLKPEGFVVLTADDEIEPVIAFSATGYYEAVEGNPLKNLLEQDIQGRLELVRQKRLRQNQAGDTANSVGNGSSKKQKWQSLIDVGTQAEAEGDGGIQYAGMTSVSDLRVAPFVLSKWGQGNEAGDYCYNYYTPNHYVTGCVATAMAQLMRYHSFPTAGIGIRSFQIYVNGMGYYYTTRGGNGSGGAYNWSAMVYDPEPGITTTQRQAIGALNYDAGLSVNMSYTSSASSASSSDADAALTSTFGYANSIFGYNFSSSGDSNLWTMMNSNLDAALPVILAINGPFGGHAVVVDGYGYHSSVQYHHLNMGWVGLDNAWYHLPDISATGVSFNLLQGCIYNVYPTGTGEIISGRVTSLAGVPLENVLVTAYIGNSQIKQSTTNSLGIYALAKLASNTQYRLSAVKSGYVFSDQYATTGKSLDWNATSGNKWGINFVASNPTPPTAFNKVVDANSINPATIRLEALDDHSPNPPDQLVYTILSLPSHGTLSEPNVGHISTVPYALAADANSVYYTPCPYFGGQDTFTFKANDGGVAPTGGDSNIATVTVNVDNTTSVEYGLDSSSYSTFFMETSQFYDARSQVIYYQSELGAAKNLTDMDLDIYIIPGTTLKNFTLRMQHANWASYPSDYSVTTMFLKTGWTTVYQANLTITQTGLLHLHFQTPFNYNGTQNLLIDFSYNNTSLVSPSGGYITKNTGATRALSLASQTGLHGDPLNWDFWAIGGSYFTSVYVPSFKITGTYPIDTLIGDFDASCNVRLPDLAMLSAAWMTQQGQAGYNSLCDISTPKNNAVDLGDLVVFAGHWLQNF